MDYLSRDELIKLVRMQAASIRRLDRQVEELFAKLNEKNPTERLDEAYSQNAEERRKKAGQERKDGRKKKQSGVKRRSIISSVLRSVGKQMNEFTLEQVISEVKQWMIRGKNCFKETASGAKRQIEPGVL